MPEEKLSLEAYKAIEDQIEKALEDKSEVWKAIVYQRLNAEGMTLERAKLLKRRAGVSK